NDEVNAFALPNGHLVINSQLIIDAKNQDEVLGVIAHELAHIHLNHINKKLAKEFGIAIVVNAIAGNNSEVLAEISQTIASNAFSRQDEREADLEAITYLERAQISPKALADFLYQDIE